MKLEPFMVRKFNPGAKGLHVLKIPVSLSETIERVYGDAGRRWIATLPSLLKECRARWFLKLSEPFENLSYNLVLPGRTSDGAEVVLKLGVPCKELLTEAAALNLFNGEGAVRLLASDAPRGILLLERVTPGVPLHKLQTDPSATIIAARLMLRLWRDPPPDNPFPSLTIWFAAFERHRKMFGGGTGPFPRELIDRAEKTFARLNASSRDNVLLHGDLHHDNILSSTKEGWVAIDPKGICGDTGYEVGSFMLNQLPPLVSEEKMTEMLARRLSIFSNELRIERKRLAQWAFCHAVLSALWSFEESAEWSGTIKLARMLEQLV